MREYGQVQCAFWQSRDAEGWSDRAKLMAVYLLSSPHSNGIGCYKLPDGYVQADLGWSSETVTETLSELSRNGFAERFEGVVFLPKFLQWNRIANENIAKARRAEFEALPRGEAKAGVARALLEFAGHLEPSFRNHLEMVYGTVPKGIPNQNPTQPNPTRESVPNGTDTSELRPDPEADEPAKVKQNHCPIAAIVDLYHECLPDLPRCEKVTDARAGYIRQRWKEDLTDLDHWRNFFGFVAQSPFLMGRSKGRDGKPPFVASLEWLTKPANFAKISEGNYHR